MHEHQHRISPDGPGLSRFVAARFMLVVMASFYLAGATLGVMYLLGIDPVTYHW
ncbi:hypothetical protein ACVW00_001584 [Marmoricola sp. URHA0025 HA25]